MHITRYILTRGFRVRSVYIENMMKNLIVRSAAESYDQSIVSDSVITTLNSCSICVNLTDLQPFLFFRISLQTSWICHHESVSCRCTSSAYFCKFYSTLSSCLWDIWVKSDTGKHIIIHLHLLTAGDNHIKLTSDSIENAN